MRPGRAGFFAKQGCVGHVLLSLQIKVTKSFSIKPLMLKLLRRPLARAFSSEVATVSEADAIKSKRWTQTVTPWNARPDLVPAEDNAVTAKNTKGFVGQLAGTPPDFLKRRARIYRRARQTTSSSSEKTKAWKIEFNNQRKIIYYMIFYFFLWFVFFL